MEPIADAAARSLSKLHSSAAWRQAEEQFAKPAAPLMLKPLWCA